MEKEYFRIGCFSVIKVTDHSGFVLFIIADPFGNERTLKEKEFEALLNPLFVAGKVKKQPPNLTAGEFNRSE